MSTTKLWYRPIGLVGGVVAGAAAAVIFKQGWRAVTHRREAPKAIDEESGWAEVLVAAAVQGAIFALVKASVDRGSAVAVRRITGSWPAK